LDISASEISRFGFLGDFAVASGLRKARRSPPPAGGSDRYSIEWGWANRNMKRAKKKTRTKKATARLKRTPDARKVASGTSTFPPFIG